MLIISLILALLAGGAAPRHRGWSRKLLYSFGDYVLDAQRRELRRGSVLITLQPQVFDLLEYLIRNRDRVVSKDELIAAIWGGRIVSESALTTRINAVRTAVGDSGEAQRLIRTLPRKGVRFVGAVQEERKRGETAVETAAGSSASIARERLSVAERRQLTVLSCELLVPAAVGRMDPEDLREMVGAFHRCARETVARFKGSVGRLVGKTVLAHFGHPTAHEDDAEQAVRAALELCAAVGRKEEVCGFRLQSRIGMSTGQVITGESGVEHAPVGEAPVIASKLQNAASPGAVLIDSATRQLVGNLFDCREIESIDADGLPDGLCVWKVLGASSVRSRFEALRPAALAPLVGREEELELLLRRWRQAKSGEGRVVLISGEPGIGKSRLTVAAQERLQAEPHSRLGYFCSPQHTDDAFYPVISQLERAARFEPNDTPDTKFNKLSSLLSSAQAAFDHVRLLAELLSIPAGAAYAPIAGSAQQKKENTLGVLLRHAEALSRERPLFVVYDDVHWIDPSTRELLDMVVERVARLPMLLLITFRSEFQPPWTGQAHVTTMALSRLGVRESEELVNRVIGKGTPLPAAIVEEIVERSDGVPLFVEELTKTVLEGGAGKNAGQAIISVAPTPSLVVPPTLYASLMARLDRLGSAAKGVLQIGAALGREFRYELLAAVSGEGEAQLQAALERLNGAGLIFRRGTPPHATYFFKHALVQDAAYGTLLRESRRALHRRIAEVLELQFPDVATAQPEILARHCAEAGLVEKAITFFQRAGEQSVARSAIREAVAQFSKGLDQVSRIPESRNRHHLELDLQSALGNVLFAFKGFAAREPARAYARVRELSELLGETTHLYRMMFGHWLLRANAGDVRAAQEIAEELLYLGEERNEPTGLLMGHLAMAGTLLAVGDFSRSRFHIERLMDLHNPVLDNALVKQFVEPLEGWAWLPMDLFLLGYPDQAREQSAKVMVAVRNRGHAPTAGWCLAAVCRFYALLGERALFVTAIEEFTALADAQNFPMWLAQATAYRGWICLGKGKAEEGVALLEKGVSDYKASGATFWLSFLMSLLAAGYRAVGDKISEAGALGEALTHAERTGAVWFTSELHRLKGIASAESAEAEREFQCALEIARRQRSMLWELRASTSLARLWRDQGKRTEARDLLAPVYGWFTEGFDTSDLKEAKALLDELAS
jgi:DNA-binding winged helix-turn-helix (wHTH) protein/tetratricopeptide (TPR) repeat protein